MGASVSKSDGLEGGAPRLEDRTGGLGQPVSPTAGAGLGGEEAHSRKRKSGVEQLEGQDKPSSPCSDGADERESFNEWKSGHSGSALSPGGTPRSNVDTLVTSGSGSTMAFMDVRPSADTPLPSHHSHEDGKPPGIGGGRASTAGRKSDVRSSLGDGTATSGTAYSVAGSVRSSFALERASLEMNRQSLEAFHTAALAPAAVALPPLPGRADPAAAAPGRASGSSFELHRMAAAMGLPPALRERMSRLAVLAPQTPVPAGMLCRLWGCTESEVASSLSIMAARGLLNVAKLPDGRLWCLPHQDQLTVLQAACKGSLASFHGALLDAYTQRGARPLAEVGDDGYFIQNVGHHLVGAGRLEALRGLLLDPGWLVEKLGAAGVAGVVADYRRYLMAVTGDRDMKLALESFQMSVGQALSHPHVPGLLRSLMVGRLMAAPGSPRMQEWLQQQQAEIRRDGQLAAAQCAPVVLPPTTPSLDQAGGLQRLALRGHKGPVTRVLLTPSGTDAITGSADGTARVWDLEIGDCVLVMEGHSGPITDMAITDDGSLLVTTSEDGTARAFETERGQCLRVLAGHTGKITGLAIDPWGRFVLTSSADGTAKVWDLSSARAIHTFVSAATPEQGGAMCVALSPCTRFAILGCANNLAEMYDVISGQRMGFMAGHSNWVVDVQFLPDGKRALTASHDGTARLWNLNNGTCKHVLEGHKGRLNKVAVSEDGLLAVTASDDGTARLWDLTNGACKKVLQGHTSWVTQVALSPAHDKVVTASADGTAIAFSLDTGDVIRVLEGHSSSVHGVVVTRKGRFAVTVSEDSTVRVFDFTANSQHCLRWHEGLIHCLAASNGIAVATAGDDCVARLWDANCGEFRGVLGSHRTAIRWATFSADGRRLATASPDRMVKVWDVETAQCLHTMPAHPGSRVKSFAVCGDLRYAAMALFDSTVTVWDLHTSEPVAVLQRWGERDSATGHSSAVNQVLMSSDGKLVVTLSKDCTSRIWDAQTGDCLHVLQGHTDGVLGGCISDIGRVLATYSYDNSVRLWALDSGACVRTLPLGVAVSRVAMSLDGWKLAIALASNAVMVLDLDHGAAPGGLWQGHSAAVTGLDFSESGDHLVTCSLDCTARLWNTATGATEGFFLGDSGLTCCHYDSVAGTVVLGTDRGVVHFLDATVAVRH